MTAIDRSSDSVTFGATQARIRDGSLAALSAVQQATSGVGPALKVTSDNADTAAVKVRGAGDLLDLQDSSGVSQFTVTNAGAVTVTGDQTVTGDYTITGDLAVTGDVDITGTADIVAAASGTDAFTVKVTGDTDPQLVVNGNGRIEFGGGAGAVDTALFRNGSAQLQTINDFVAEGNLILDVAGKGVRVKEGSNARMGTATLVGGTVTVANTSVTANTRIFVSRSTTGGTEGHLSTTQTASTEFVINSSSGTDTSTVNWLLIEPA